MIFALLPGHGVGLGDDQHERSQAGQLLDEFFVDVLDAVWRDEVEHAVNAAISSVASLQASEKVSLLKEMLLFGQVPRYTFSVIGFPLVVSHAS